MVPSGSKKQELIINAQAKGIIIKPDFHKLIRSQRCLVIASAKIMKYTLVTTKSIGKFKSPIEDLNNMRKEITFE